MTEYRETGYGSDRYPPRDGGNPDGGGTVYRGGAQRGDDQEYVPGQDQISPYDPAASIRGRVWRPTRGPRAEEGVRGNPAYGAPERGWRTSDGGYRSPDGGWRAPYRPYDTGEWRRDQRPDTGLTSTGEIAAYSSGEIVRYPPPVTGEPAGYRPAATDAGSPSSFTQQSPEPPHTGEIVRYRGGGADASGYPAIGASGTPPAGIPRYPADGAPGYPTPRRGQAGHTGEIVPYRPGPAQPSGYPDEPRDAGRRPYRTGETGEMTRYPSAANPYRTGEITRPGGSADDPAATRGPTAETGETSRIPRQRPTSPAGDPPARPRRRALESGRRDDSPELYTYDPLTFGGGESPAMRYDRASESFRYDAPPAEPPPPPSASPVPPSSVPESRRPPRGAADPRLADPRRGDPRDAPRTVGYSARAIEAREYDGRAPAGGGYGGPGYQREPAPGSWTDMPGRRPVGPRPDQPPARRPAARAQQRFEGTYPRREVRAPRNVMPIQRRAGLDPDDEEPEDAPGFVHTALVTTAWYTIPLLLYTMYVLTLDGSAQAGDGQSPRANALNGLLGGMPRIGVALATSLAVALLIRAISRGWRAATIGFASAVVGAGAATVIFAALTG